MKYKTSFTNDLDNLKEQVRTLKRGIENREISGPEAIDVLANIEKLASKMDNYVRLERNDFSSGRREDAPINKSMPTPPRGPRREKSVIEEVFEPHGEEPVTKRVTSFENNNESKTKRVE